MRRALFLFVFLVGCGGSAATDPGADRPAFDQAVAAYLEAHNMDLKIEQYKAFSIGEDGNTATAEIAMGYAGGMIKATARFFFEFEKNGDAWTVTDCSQK